MMAGAPLLLLFIALSLLTVTMSIKTGHTGLVTLEVEPAVQDSNPLEFATFKGHNCRELPILPAGLTLHCFDLSASGRTCVPQCKAKMRKLSASGVVTCSVETGWSDIPACVKATEGLAGCGKSLTNVFLNSEIEYINTVLDYSHIAESWDYSFIFHQASFVMNKTHVMVAGRQLPFLGVNENTVGSEPVSLMQAEWTANALPFQIAEIDYGFYHLLILTANMEVYTFGLNVDDCLYVDGAQYQYTPLYKVAVPTTHGYPVSVRSSGHSNWITLSSGQAYYSGDRGHYYALGQGANKMMPMPEGDSRPEFGSNSAYNTLLRTASGRFYFRGVVETEGKFVDYEDNLFYWIEAPFIGDYDVLTFGHNTFSAILILENGNVMVSNTNGNGYYDATAELTAICEYPTTVHNGHDMLYVTGQCGATHFAAGFMNSNTISGMTESCISPEPAMYTFFKMPDVPGPITHVQMADRRAHV
eukprot:TRINITY_DN46099_c0_g1_i1.p1 TRINITY_DN46099_c0_g1~~TRINITY_DN46099_c0_g1_i1.p1  ORF type:complete len:473 (+),score=59.64 TRINITY_DN46099_c0_g1_i1:45-1463(+)